MEVSKSKEAKCKQRFVVHAPSDCGCTVDIDCRFVYVILQKHDAPQGIERVRYLSTIASLLINSKRLVHIFRGFYEITGIAVCDS